MLQANIAFQILASLQTVLDIVKLDNLHGKNICGWLQSLDSYPAAQCIEQKEGNSLRLAMSSLSGEGLQWGELLSLQHFFIHTHMSFKESLLNHCEPVNRELNARKTLSSLKELSTYSSIRPRCINFQNVIYKSLKCWQQNKSFTIQKN